MMGALMAYGFFCIFMSVCVADWGTRKLIAPDIEANIGLAFVIPGIVFVMLAALS